MDIPQTRGVPDDGYSTNTWCTWWWLFHKHVVYLMMVIPQTRRAH